MYRYFIRNRRNIFDFIRWFPKRFQYILIDEFQDINRVQYEVIRMLAKLGMTMLIVTHEMGFAAEVADRVVFMEGGHVVEQGPPDRLFQSPESPRLAAFLKSWTHRNGQVA